MKFFSSGRVKCHEACTSPLHLYTIHFGIIIKVDKNDCVMSTSFNMYEFCSEASFVFIVMSMGSL